MNKTPADQALTVIVDTITEGYSFALLRSLVLEMETRANAGDVAAQKIINIVLQFSRLTTLSDVI